MAGAGDVEDGTDGPTSGVAPAALSFLEIFRMPEVRAATVGTFVVMLGYGIVSPVLPNYARSFGVGYDAVGLLIAGFSFARLVADPFCGRVIDRFGERRTSAGGAAIVGVSSIAAGLAPTFPLLLLFRSLGGVGSAVFFAAMLSFLLRTVPPERTGRVMSVFFGAFNVGFIAGGPLGGVIANAFKLRTPLHIYGVSCFVAAWLFWRTIYDPTRSKAEDDAPGWRHLPWRDRAFLAVLASNASYLWFVGAIYSTLIPLFGRDIVGLSLSGVGLALAIATGTELVCLFPAGKLTDSHGRRAVLLPSLVAMAVIGSLIGVASIPLVFMVLMAVMGVTTGFGGVPEAPMLGDVTRPEMKGSAVAMFRFFGDLGFVVGPLAAGWAADALGFTGAFIVSAAPVLIAAGLVASVPETMPSRGRTGEAGL
jgi:MFS transporter, ACDE family, multidrug resistance protein